MLGLLYNFLLGDEQDFYFVIKLWDYYKKYKNELDSYLIKIEKRLPISLLGKWLPSINTSSKETVKYAKKLAKGFGMSDKEYRKTLSILRFCSNVLEVKLSKNKWSDVDYEIVPSKANLKYEKAFMRHDKERRTKFIIDTFEKDGKINYCMYADSSCEDALTNFKPLAFCKKVNYN